MTQLDEFWHRKYAEDDDGRVRRIATGEEVAQSGDGTGVHLPSPSYWPLVVTVSFPIIGYGLLYTLWLTLVGVIILLVGLYGWVIEPPDDIDQPHGPDDDHDDDEPTAAEASDQAGTDGAEDDTEEADDATSDEATESEEAPVG